MDLRMKKSRLWMLAAILLCCTMAVLTSCKSKSTAGQGWSRGLY